MMSESASTLRHFWSILRDQQVSTFIRVIAAIDAVVMILLGYGPLFTADGVAYSNAVFNGVFAFASPVAWGVGFWTAAALLMIASISGRGIIYLASVIVASVTLMGWCSGIIIEVWQEEDAVLTSGAFAYYIGTFTSLVGMAFSPNQMRHERQVVGLVPHSGTVVPLQRLG